MATLETVMRNAFLQGGIDELIASGTVSTLVFETAGDVEVATCLFSSSAFASASAGVSTAAAITDDSSATGGTVEHVSFYNSTPTKLLEATIATDTTQDFTISSLDIGVGDTVGCSSLTITVPAS